MADDRANPDGSAEESALRASARLVESLRDPHRFPEATGPIRVIETHISVILLTGVRAYKLKKPLRLAFLDFSSLASRRRMCEEELRLNRRTAPELYLRVVAITGSIDDPWIDGEGPAIEYAVEMRQFDPDALFAQALAAGRVEGSQVDALADRVAAFHAALADSDADDAIPAPVSAAAERSSAAARRNVAELRALAPPAAVGVRIDELAGWLDRTCARFESLLAARARAGFVRDCHGDLHLSNVALVDGRPVLFDCLEFDAGLRTIDVIDEVAFAFMDFLALD